MRIKIALQLPGGWVSGKRTYGWDARGMGTINPEFPVRKATLYGRRSNDQT